MSPHGHPRKPTRAHRGALLAGACLLLLASTVLLGTTLAVETPDPEHVDDQFRHKDCWVSTENFPPSPLSCWEGPMDRP